MATALRRLAGVPGSPSAAAAALLFRPALTRPISTGFREERDTFGPIQVPNDKCVAPSSPPPPPPPVDTERLRSADLVRRASF